MKDIFIDLDNTLMDFNGRYKQVTGVEYSTDESAEVRWKRLEGKQEGFYLGMSPFWGATKFLEEVLALGGVGSVCILSALPSKLDFPTAYDEKIRSVSEKLHRYISVIISSNSESKQYHAYEGAILIDDNPLNIKQWESRGGEGVLHRNFATSLEQLKNLLLKD